MSHVSPKSRTDLKIDFLKDLDLDDPGLMFIQIVVFIFSLHCLKEVRLEKVLDLNVPSITSFQGDVLIIANN